ncbi:L,D-transpeptidase family protein [Cryomorphaceae bacterium S-15]|uniref:L,D-transpeptidase family protein n=1 Tax=Acidiluteibacter ferrifornacis TaxID=2692424 RepID=A0A6N9NK93_9FLAO|nr:L,D-transpeptidase family protein [Acidiluteibacter ferrifornacis]
MIILILAFFVFSSPLNAGGIASFIDDYINIKYQQSFDSYIFVSIKRQKLFYIKNGNVEKVFLISTAKKGIGQEIHSQQTPEGLHVIKHMIGQNLPKNAIFKERVFNGEIAEIYTDKTDINEDFVTSRIMWLEGQEEGINKGGNVDSYKRYIYIHGTPEEGLIGKPASHGCVRMKNKEVIELFDLVQVNTPVLILNY